jgi:hypothetical protein
MAADFVALGALALLVGGLIVFSPLRRKGWWLGGAAAAGIGLLLAAQGARGAGSFTPAAHGANLGDEVTLLAYQIENPAVRAGEELGVKLYWYVQKSPGENRKVFLHLNRPDDSGRVAQVDQEPLLGYFPTTQWEGGQIFADEYRVEIPAEAPPGRYVLTGGMYRPDPLQNLPVAPGENVWPGDRVWLGEVEVAP